MNGIPPGLSRKKSRAQQRDLDDASTREQHGIRTCRVDDRLRGRHCILRANLSGLRFHGCASRSHDYRGTRKRAHRNSDGSHLELTMFGDTMSPVFASSRVIMCISSTASDNDLALFARNTTNL